MVVVVVVLMLVGVPTKSDSCSRFPHIGWPKTGLPPGLELLQNVDGRMKIPVSVCLCA